MIDIKTGTKAKKNGTTGGGSSKTTYINGTISEADHASRADKAKKAEVAEKAEYAVKAGNAQTANYALKAGELDEDAEVLEKYVRKDIDDTVHGSLTMEKRLKLLQGLTADEVVELLKGFVIGRYGMDANGNLVVHDVSANDVSAHGVTSASVQTDELTAKGKAVIELLQVDGNATIKGNTAIGGNTSIGGDTTMGGTVSSPDFASGFLSGKGWRIANVPTTNAAGETEQKATAELDNIIVRGTLRIFEMIVSQLLGENDNRIFSAMLEVDHFDPATGKVYLDTHEGKMLNPFRHDDCIMVQQYNGMPSAENQSNISKAYELIIDEVGSEGEGEQMLAWVTFHGFTSTIEDATPEALIQKRDTFVRVDNLTDPDRKGIIQMMTVGTDTPYIDIIHGLKTDPAGALKGRLGNLQGIIHPLFGALRGFGEYLQNLYATGDFILRRTGESIDTKIQMLQNQFATRFSQTSYEASEEQNYLHNGQFLQATGSTDDALLIDGWQIDEGEDAQFWVDANGMPVMLNRELTTSGNHKVQIDNCEGRNVLHIISSGISQANALIKQPGTHTEYTQPQADATATTAASREVQDTLYIMARVYANTASTLTIGFAGCTEVSGKTNTLQARTIQLADTGDWQTINLEGTWNGTGNFQLKADGNLLIEQVIITDEPLANLAKTVSTQIQQTATNIKLLGENISKVDGKTTQLGIDINAKDKEIRQYVDEKDEKNRQDTSSAITQTSKDITAYVDKTVEDTKANITESYKSEIKQTADGINATVEQVKETADGNSSSIAKLQQTAKDITISVSKVETAASTAQSTADKAQTSADNAQGAADKAQTSADNAQGAADKAQTSADNAQGAADKAQSAADTAQADANAANASISKLQVSVNEISTAVGKAATKEELSAAEEKLNATIKSNTDTLNADIQTNADNIKSTNDSLTKGVQEAKDHADNVGTGIRNDYATTITKVQQYSDSWSVAAGAFDKNGNLVQCSGETIDTHFATLFSQKVKTDKDGNITNISKSGLLVTADKAELETKITNVDGKVVERATISTMITDGISNATIKANQIKLEGAVTANNYFKINTDGSMEAKAGKIAGFTISGNGLTNDPFTNDAYIVFRNDSHKCFAGIGGNVMPASSGSRAVARFENEDQSDWWSLGYNVALYLSAKNAKRNYAFLGNGNGMLNGWISGFRYSAFTINKSNTIFSSSYISISENNVWHVYQPDNISGGGVELPRLSEVRNALCIGSNTDFAVEFTIIASPGSGDFQVYGRNRNKDSKEAQPWNTEELPLMLNNDAGNYNSLGMAGGDVLRVLLSYKRSRTKSSIDSFSTYYTAQIFIHCY